MAEEAEIARLVSFLGTRRYDSVVYELEGARAQKNPYVARALAELLCPKAIYVLATEEAEAKHGEGLREALSTLGGPQPEFVRIPSGKERSEQLALFEILKNALREGEDRVVLDITHGFRAQPFLTAAVVAFLRAVDEPPPEIRVLYGAFEAKSSEGIAPIWDLTYLVELLDWTAALRMLLKTGRAEEAAEQTKRLGASLAKAWAKAGRSGPRPELDRLGKALRAFGADLESLRTGDLLLGRPGQKPSAVALIDALEAARTDVQAHLPPLADVLERVRTMVAPLAGRPDHLASPEGLAAVAALARLYLELGRWLEAAATLREGWLNLYVEVEPDLARPAQQGCNHNAREDLVHRAEEDPATSLQWDELKGLRNDLLHAQYRASNDARHAETIMRQLKRLASSFEERIRQAGTTASR